MYSKRGYMAVNYLDDFGGAETKEKANGAYDIIRLVIRELRARRISRKKCCTYY
jgi:hypothetical protein